MAAGVHPARDRRLHARVIVVGVGGMHGRVSLPARLAVDLDHVDLAARGPADLAVVRPDHPPRRPRPGGQVALDPCLARPTALRELVLRRQPRARVCRALAATRATRGLHGLDHEGPLPVLIAVGARVGGGLQLVVVGPAPEVVAPQRGVRSTPGGVVELIIERVRGGYSFVSATG